MNRLKLSGIKALKIFCKNHYKEFNLRQKPQTRVKLRSKKIKNNFLNPQKIHYQINHKNVNLQKIYFRRM